MQIIEDVLVSDELLEKCFCCDIAKCHGLCCVEGDAGAPIAPDEIADLEDNYPIFKKYMTDEGVATVETGGTFIFDGVSEFLTPLLPSNNACAFAYFENDIAKCAIEKAFLNGEIGFRKPISCHLYPIRVSRVGKYEALNYHHWSVCKSACDKGQNLKLPVFQFLKEPLIRKYGEKWYRKLL